MDSVLKIARVCAKAHLLLAIVRAFLKIKSTESPGSEYNGRKIFLNSEAVIAIMSVLGTVIGSFGGIVTSSKLTSFRLEKLEEKVDKHNGFAERMPVIEEQIKVINHRLNDLEKGDSV